MKVKVLIMHIYYSTNHALFPIPLEDHEYCKANIPGFCPSLCMIRFVLLVMGLGPRLLDFSSN